MRVLFDKLHAPGLKVDAPKCSFGLKDIPYLGNILKKEGIKPVYNKVKMIMVIRRSNTTTGSRFLNRMV